jgi:AcrR family transcriptional regulator
VERSRAIIEATLDVFAREGCSGATTRQIAHAAGVSEALVFRHFPTKESLYSAILLSRIEESERVLPLDGSLESLDDEAFFLRVAAATLKRVETDQTFLRLFLHSALEGHELFREFYKVRVERLLSAIEGRVREIQRRRGGRQGLDPALAARAFHGMLFAAVVSRHVFKDRASRRASIDRQARTLVKIFLDGIDPRKEKS